MFRVSKAELALIGGDAMARTVEACRLRRLGYSVFTGFGNRKRGKMVARASDEALRVLDLDSAEDAEELLLFEKKVIAPDFYPPVWSPNRANPAPRQLRLVQGQSSLRPASDPPAGGPFPF